MIDEHRVVRAKDQPATGGSWWWIVSGADIPIAFLAISGPLDAANRREYDIFAECISIHANNFGAFTAEEVTQDDIVKIWCRHPKRALS
jgi:hypothetical protein